MSRYVAILDVNDEVLQEAEEGSLAKALEWCCDSGVRLQEYMAIYGDYKLHSIVEKDDNLEVIKHNLIKYEIFNT